MLLKSVLLNKKQNKKPNVLPKSSDRWALILMSYKSSWKSRYYGRSSDGDGWGVGEALGTGAVSKGLGELEGDGDGDIDFVFLFRVFPKEDKIKIIRIND